MAAMTWTPRDAPTEDTPLFSNRASVGGVSDTLVGTLLPSRCDSCYNALFMSRDGMRTWRRIDAGVFIQKGGRIERDSSRFWLESSGELLTETNNHMSPPFDELWRSSDQGAHWSQIGIGSSGMVDPGGIGPGDIIVADRRPQLFWRACAAYQHSGGRTHPPVQQISCTVDGGATWLSRPIPRMTKARQSCCASRRGSARGNRLAHCHLGTRPRRPLWPQGRCGYSTTR